MSLFNQHLLLSPHNCHFCADCTGRRGQICKGFMPSHHESPLHSALHLHLRMFCPCSGCINSNTIELWPYQQSLFSRFCFFPAPNSLSFSQPLEVFYFLVGILAARLTSRFKTPPATDLGPLSVNCRGNSIASSQSLGEREHV